MTSTRCVPLAALLSLAGCKSSPVDAKPPPAPIETSAVATGAKPMTTDLDVDTLLNWFGPPIPGQPDPLVPKDDARRVVKDFKSGTPLTAFPTSGEEIWFGKSYLVYADGTSGETFQFLRFKPGRGEAPGVDPAVVLPWVAFTSSLETQSGAEEADATGLFAAVTKGAALQQGSGALKFIRAAKPVDGYHALLKSDGASKVLLEKDLRWLRKSGDRLLVLQRIVQFSGSSKRPSHTAGRYAELWKLP